MTTQAYTNLRCCPVAATPRPASPAAAAEGPACCCCCCRPFFPSTSSQVLKDGSSARGPPAIPWPSARLQSKTCSCRARDRACCCFAVMQAAQVTAPAGSQRLQSSQRGSGSRME